MDLYDLKSHLEGAQAFYNLGILYSQSNSNNCWFLSPMTKEYGTNHSKSWLPF